MAISKVARGAVLAVLSCALICGCVSGNWPRERKLAPADVPAERTLASAPFDTGEWPADAWWRAYGDPQLDELIQQALAGSPSLEIAQARLRTAQAQVTAARGARLPQTSLDAEIDRQRFPVDGLYPPPYAGNSFTEGRLALDLSYEIDFWGLERQRLAAARADARAARADQAAARLALAVAVTKAYVQLDLWYNLRDVARSNLEQQTAIRDLTQQRVTAGLENTARVKQSESLLALTRASVDEAQGSIDMAQNALAALAGQGPDRALSVQRPHLTAPQRLSVPASLPADLLGRRPDIVAARWRVEAASHGVKAAEAAFYPNVSLTAFAGVQSIGLDNLLEGPNRVMGAGPALNLPVFNRDALHGVLQAQQAQYNQAVGEYNQTLIDSMHQVADVVVGWRALESETLEQQTAYDAAQRSYDLTQQRYGAGLDNYLSVLSSQNQVLLTQALHAALIARRLNYSIDLIRALGGGYTG